MGSSENTDTKNPFQFGKIPVNEEEYSGWRFEAYRNVRAKFLHVKQTLSTEQKREVDKYVNAFLHGDVITVVSDLEAYDASVGVAACRRAQQLNIIFWLSIK